MQVRLAFAVAAHLEPEILLVDEVLAVGDAAFQKKCLGKMGDVAKEGRTVLFVSHNMTAIEALCPRAVLLEGGCLVDDDHSSQTIGRYLTSIVDRTPSDLRRRTDRQGTGVIRIVSFEILDSESKPVDSLITGKEYVFRFGYESRATKVYDIDFGFTVRDLRNQIFFRNRTSESGLTLPERISPCGYLDCKMRRLPLTAGRYAFGFRLLVNGIEADYITGGYAAYFDVVNGDYFGTGKITDFAPLVVEHTWQIVTGNTG
jgi:lipopolysaccharide transport system ATP-binding protein